jgi:hypothetical protein
MFVLGAILRELRESGNLQEMTLMCSFGDRGW